MNQSSRGSRPLFRSVLSQRSIARLNRVRYPAKLRLLRDAGTAVHSAPGAYFRYLLFDDELHTFTYRLANETELAATVAEVLDTDPRHVLLLFEEGRAVLHDRLRRRRGRCGEPSGRRLAWYAAARIRRPHLIVESGVARGLGSAVLLAALEKNETEGYPGHLLSIDPAKGAGFVVPASMRRSWTLIRGTAPEALRHVASHGPIDLYVHDSVSTGGPAELREALAHAGQELLFMTVWDTPETQDALRSLHARRTHFVEEALHPVHKGSALAFGVVRRPERFALDSCSPTSR